MQNLHSQIRSSVQSSSLLLADPKSQALIEGMAGCAAVHGSKDVWDYTTNDTSFCFFGISQFHVSLPHGGVSIQLGKPSHSSIIP